MVRLLSFITAAALLSVTGCEKRKDTAEFDIKGSMELKYSEQFRVDYCENGCSVVDIDGAKYLIVPEDVDIPDDTTGMTVIKQPVENIYVAATSAMDLFDSIGGLNRVTMTSTTADSWSLPVVKDAVSSGDIEYIGKYSSPDYETLVAEKCGLALESTMIYHTPKVKEQLESFDIPVMVERSSYETHPLGRMEWVKLYGLILGDYEAAEQLFSEKTKAFEELSVGDIPDTERKTAAFFYVTSNGYFNIRKPADYVARMIGLAGGKYIFTADDLSVDDNALSTMNIQAETFYELAHDADILIYNSTIDGELNTIDELIGKNSILADFRAVREGNVWCTGQNMFQQTTGAADMICDLNSIFTDKADSAELTYLHRLD
jgi:iron complex transport system substrate-binding protein